MTAGEIGDLNYRIIKRLEEHNRCPPDFRLYDVINPDALESLVVSADDDLLVKFQVGDLTVVVTGTGTVRLCER